MPIERLTQGIFSPTEIDFLSRVFRAGATLTETEEQREQRASRIIASYMAGIADEKELIEVSRKPLGRY